MGKMTEEEFKDKLSEYISRNDFWTEKTINQLGYSVNLFTTVGIALLGYLVTNRDKFPHLYISCDAEFNGILALYMISAITIIVSIGFGFASILSRLFDFRITRHLALSRKRFLSRNKEKALNNNSSEALIDSKIIDISNEKYCPIFKKYLLGKAEFINETDFEESNVIEKFEELRKESKILGNLTWKFHGYQICLFFLTVIIYAFTILR
jgi:hypothetical protein